MRRIAIVLFVTIICTVSAFAQRIQIKNIAVVETQIIEASGAAELISRAEVMAITTEIRVEAVKNLPRDRFSIMTTETVQSMGDAVLAECAEENCVIALGTKIGADYIVRGIISKFVKNLTLSVEMFETEYGMLVATSATVRTPNLEEFLEKGSEACAAMFRKFVEESSRRGQQIISAQTPEPAAAPPSANLSEWGYYDPPAATVPAPTYATGSPLSEPRKAAAKKTGMSAGVYGAFGMDFGNGINGSGRFYDEYDGYSYERSASISWTSMGGGFGVFFDAKFVEISVGITFTGGDIDEKSEDKSNGEIGYYREITYPSSWMNLNVGLMGKYPIILTDNKTLLPMVGISYAWCLSGESKFKRDGEWRTGKWDGKVKAGPDWPEAGDMMSQFFINLGVGLDFALSESVSFRPSVIYGLGFPTKYISNMVDGAADEFELDESFAHSLTIRAGLGFKF